MPQTGFQRTVNRFPALGVPGDFASVNPLHTMLHGGAGAHVAGPNGVTIGQFAWVDATDTFIHNVNNGVAGYLAYTAGLPVGFVHRIDNLGAIQVPLLGGVYAETNNIVPGGYEMAISDGGDFWAAAPATGATMGQKVFMATATGAIGGTAIAGGAVAGAVETSWWCWTTCDTTAGQVIKISKFVPGV